VGGWFTGSDRWVRIKREHWRIDLRIYALLAKPLRLFGVDLNWVFDPVTQLARLIVQRAAPERPEEVEQSHREE